MVAGTSMSMGSVILATIRRELLLALRSPGDVINP